MGLALAVLVLAFISVGFIALMFLPLVFVWLAVSVYTEPWRATVPAEPEAAAPPPVPETKPEEQAEKPRVMVAGRRPR
jgi:hypothetical protein